MQQHWKKLEAWLAANDPALLADLNPPAADANIRALERHIGVELPADFIACLKIHNGQRGEAQWLFDGHAFLSIDDILMDWDVWADLLDGGDFDGRIAKPDGEVMARWWQKAWIPFTSNGGDHLCLDMNPSGHGRKGQVIKVLHDFPSRSVKAPSFTQWFSDFVDGKSSRI